ncbi:MAG: DUF420 domain-containing protein [Gemmatimonadetes bacterium]|nr:MAG: DUF420 domain-containing protein [Gemmatimonadota bacterium]
MEAERLGDLLAVVNAGLNATSATLLLAGFAFIRAGRIERHRACMLGALAASGLFLVFYLVRYSLTGTHEFAGEGPARTVYLGVLFSHMFLAVLIVPLVGRLVFLALKERFDEHRRLARWTYPMWLYVSLTGLTVYVLLYHVYGYR